MRMNNKASVDWKKEAWFGILLAAYIIAVGWYSAKLGEAILPQSFISWFTDRCRPEALESNIRTLRFLTGLGFMAMLLGFHGYVRENFRRMQKARQSENG